jgi:hypothetical protein
VKIIYVPCSCPSERTVDTIRAGPSNASWCNRLADNWSGSVPAGHRTR